MLTFLAVLLLTIASLYGYTVSTTTNAVKREIESSRLNQLSFLASQLEDDIDQVALNAYNLLQDPSLRDYAALPSIGHLLDRNKLKLAITEKLELQSTASAWPNTLTIYFPSTGNILSSDPNRARISAYDFRAPAADSWMYVQSGIGSPISDEFVLYVHDRRQSSGVSIAASFPVENIRKLLDSFEHQSDPFLYHPSGRYIFNHDSDSVTSVRMARRLSKLPIEDSISLVEQANGMSYQLNAVPTTLKGWYLVDYTPLERVLQPIRRSTTLFFLTTAVLLCLGIAFAFELYRNVQLPIRKLVSGLSRFKEGDYGVRMGFVPAREFQLLTEGFNEMAKRVGDLIGKVFAEELRAKEAEFKQLQSQINPHFLYNCLFFIKSKAKIGDTESVEAMSLALGEYYRYMTRSEHGIVPLRSELELIGNYMSIQDLRKQRIHYENAVPDELLDAAIPRLMLQPLVENAVLHGIEPKLGRGMVRISGERIARGFSLTVADDGVGMSPEACKKLTDALSGPIAEGIGYGIWNVRQRLVKRYGAGSTVVIESKPGEGTSITLICIDKEKTTKENDEHANSAGR